MDCEVVNPDDQYWNIDWKDPEHEDEDRVRIVVEVCSCMLWGRRQGRRKAGVFGGMQSAYARC